MQVSTLCAQLGLGKQQTDWYRDATSSPYVHLLIDLLPRTDNRSRYLTNAGSIPSKFLNPGPAESVKTFRRWTRKISPLSKCSNHFPTNAKVVCFSLAQKIPERMFSKYNQRKHAKHKKTSRDKISKGNPIVLSEKSHLEAKKRRSGSRKRVTTHKIITPPVINQFSWHGAVCFCFCFCLQQVFENPVSYKTGASKVPTFTKSHIPVWFAEEVIKQKLFAEADSLVDKFLFCPRMELSKSQTLRLLDCVRTGVLLSDFAQQLRRKISDFPDI